MRHSRTRTQWGTSARAGLGAERRRRSAVDLVSSGPCPSSDVDAVQGPGYGWCGWCTAATGGKEWSVAAPTGGRAGADAASAWWALGMAARRRRAEREDEGEGEDGAGGGAKRRPDAAARQAKAKAKAKAKARVGQDRAEARQSQPLTLLCTYSLTCLFYLLACLLPLQAAAVSSAIPHDGCALRLPCGLFHLQATQQSAQGCACPFTACLVCPSVALRLRLRLRLLLPPTGPRAPSPPWIYQQRTTSSLSSRTTSTPAPGVLMMAHCCNTHLPSPLVTCGIVR